jgi:hypothetical protein
MALTCSLVSHPSTPTTALDGVEVTADRLPGGKLRLDFLLRGNRGAIVWALREDQPQRKDRLWEETCFEAFVMAGDGPGYVELNFAFTHDWAAYSFSARRDGMANAAIPAPLFDLESGEGDLTVEVDLNRVDGFAAASDWRLGLSAVLIDRRNETSYWALAHPPGPPDFHDPACFTARLAAPPGA